MAYQQWGDFFPGSVDNLFKGQYGSVLVRDYDATKSLANYTPFDSTSGYFSTTLLTTDGWIDLGYMDENGIEFTPSFQTADVKAWQSRQKLRTDVTEDVESAMVNCLETKPVVDALANNLPMSSLSPIGTAGYQFTKPKVTVPIVRQVMFLGLDQNQYGVSGFARIYPRALMVKPDKLVLNAKTETQTRLTLESYPDKIAGFAVRTLRDGPGWRALGGTTATTGTPTATVGAGAGLASLTFAAPTSPNGPFTYNVYQDAATSPIPQVQVTVGGTATNPILSLTGITPAGAHTFKVQAIGGNLSASALSTASNSITTT